jgi:hypothetical protein
MLKTAARQHRERPLKTTALADVGPGREGVLWLPQEDE